jgi:hypothetical protein
LATTLAATLAAFLAATSAAVLAAVLAATPANAADWPQFLGPNGDGQSAETGLIRLLVQK